jgi:hypothetical protein
MKYENLKAATEICGVISKYKTVLEYLNMDCEVSVNSDFSKNNLIAILGYDEMIAFKTTHQEYIANLISKATARVEQLHKDLEKL